MSRAPGAQFTNNLPTTWSWVCEVLLRCKKGGGLLCCKKRGGLLRCKKRGEACCVVKKEEACTFLAELSCWHRLTSFPQLIFCQHVLLCQLCSSTLFDVNFCLLTTLIHNVHLQLCLHRSWIVNTTLFILNFVFSTKQQMEDCQHMFLCQPKSKTDSRRFPFGASSNPSSNPTNYQWGQTPW